MTREETFRFVERYVNDNWDKTASVGCPYKPTVLALEALGLVHFDDPPPAGTFSFPVDGGKGGMVLFDRDVVLRVLAEAGYRVVKEYEVANGWIGPGREPLSGLKKSSS